MSSFPAVACQPLCELCVKRGYNFCANIGKTSPITIADFHDINHLKPTVQSLMDLARKFRSAPGELYDVSYKELQDALYAALSP